MTFRAFLLAVIILTGCATIPVNGYISPKLDRIPVRIENNVFSRATIYVLNRGINRRIGECAGVSVCNLWINPVLTETILQEGYAKIGWRWGVTPPGAYESLSLLMREGMGIALVLNHIGVFISPGSVLSQAD